jgi:hypothetical protein
MGNTPSEEKEHSETNAVSNALLKNNPVTQEIIHKRACIIIKSHNKVITQTPSKDYVVDMDDNIYTTPEKLIVGKYYSVEFVETWNKETKQHVRNITTIKEVHATTQRIKIKSFENKFTYKIISSVKPRMLFVYYGSQFFVCKTYEVEVYDKPYYGNNIIKRFKWIISRISKNKHIYVHNRKDYGKKRDRYSYNYNYRSNLELDVSKSYLIEHFKFKSCENPDEYYIRIENATETGFTVRNIVICDVISDFNTIKLEGLGGHVIITDGNDELYFCHKELLPLNPIGNKFVIEVYDKPLYSYVKSDSLEKESSDNCEADVHVLRSIKLK